jgi:hypothetical protein
VIYEDDPLDLSDVLEPVELTEVEPTPEQTTAVTAEIGEIDSELTETEPFLVDPEEPDSVERGSLFDEPGSDLAGADADEPSERK